MLDTYGGLAAQIVTPIFSDGRLEAIVSVHALGAPRAWSDEDTAACRSGGRPRSGSCCDAQPLASGPGAGRDGRPG